MALSDEILQEIVSNLTPEERKQLFSQLGKQLKQDKTDIANGLQPQSPINRPQPIKKPQRTTNASNLTEALISLQGILLIQR